MITSVIFRRSVVVFVAKPLLVSAFKIAMIQSYDHGSLNVLKAFHSILRLQYNFDIAIKCKVELVLDFVELG